MIDTVLNALSWVLLAGGGVFVVIGGIGVLRMPDFYTRLHAASVTESLGAIMILLGLMMQGGLSLVTVKLVIVLFFLLFTSPTSAYALANAALLGGLKAMVDKPEEAKDRTRKEGDND